LNALAESSRLTDTGLRAWPSAIEVAVIAAGDGAHAPQSLGREFALRTVPEELTADALARATQLIEKRDHGAAASLLEDALRDDPSAATHALLGTAYLLAERYEDAERHLAIAVQKDPFNEGHQTKLTLASANVVSNAKEDHPPVQPFDRAALLEIGRAHV